MKCKMQRKHILTLVVVVGILFGITCSAGCITEADSHSPNDIVGKWYFENDDLTIEFNEDNVATWQYLDHPWSSTCEWKYLGSGIYYAYHHSGDMGTFFLKDDVLYGGNYVLFSKKDGPKNSIVGTWYAGPSPNSGNGVTITINNNLYAREDYVNRYDGEIRTSYIQLTGSGKCGEVHQNANENKNDMYYSPGAGFVASSEYMILVFGDKVSAKKVSD